MFSRIRTCFIHSLVLGVFILGAFPHAHAKTRHVKTKIPAQGWKISNAAKQTNSSYLESTSGGYANMEMKDFQEQILDRKSTLVHRQAYEDMNRDYEIRKMYGLTTQIDERNHVQSNSSFSKGVVRSVFNFQIDQSFKKAEKNSSEGAVVKQFKDGVESAVAGTSQVAASGDRFKLGTRTNLKEQQGSVFVESEVLNLSMGANMSDKINTGGLLNSGNRPEDHYTLSAGRVVPLLDLGSNISYGIESTKMRTSLSKQLTSEISAELAQNRGLNRFKSKGLQREEVITINYGFRF